MDTNANDETFIRLVQVFRDDGDLGSYFQKLTAMDGATRAATLKRIAASMRQDGVGEDLATAAEKLTDPGLWDKVVAAVRSGQG